MEGLHQVVVPAQVQALDAVLEGVPGGEEEDGPLVARFPRLLCEAEAAVLVLGKAHVQDHEVGLQLQEGLPGLSQAPGPANPVALGGEGPGHRLPQAGLVLQKKHLHPSSMARPG